jgi:hypothetical protein
MLGFAARMLRQGVGVDELRNTIDADELRNRIDTATAKIVSLSWKPDAVPPTWLQELSWLPSPHKRRLRKWAEQQELGWGWWKQFEPTPAIHSHPVDAPAPASDQAENARALQLRALARQQSRRGPPRDESDGEDPLLGGLRRAFDLDRRSVVAVRRWFAAGRAARRRI